MTRPHPSCSSDLEFRGLVHQVSDEEVLKRLDEEPLTAYAGFDATADSLHVGHLLGVLTLRRLQLAGHRPIALLGSATASVGDPGGRTEERELIDLDQVEANLEGIRAQLGHLLDSGDGKAEAILVDNSTWLRDVRLIEFLRDVGKYFTVGQMVSKESVRSRLESREQGISFSEFSYMLLQAYDYLRLFESAGCRLQLGGSDQWGNITMGIDLIRRRHRVDVWGLTWPLVVRPDGGKLGKTEEGTVWLDAGRTSPYELYQYFVRTDDRIVGAFLRYFTWLSHEEIESLDQTVLNEPEKRQAQRALAREVTALVHGKAEASRVERVSDALFSGNVSSLDESSLLEAFADAPSSIVSRRDLDSGDTRLVDCLVSSGLVRSKSAARTTVGQGGVYVNLRRETDPDRPLGSADLLSGGYILLSRGRKDHHLLRVE